MSAENCGWASDFPTFHGTAPRIVRVSLERFVREAGRPRSPGEARHSGASAPLGQREQVAAWDEAQAKTHVVILEYKLPLEERRPDAVMLPRGGVVVRGP